MNHGMTGRLSYQSETVLMFGGLGAHQSSVIHFKVTLLQNNFMVFEYWAF